MRLPNAEAAVIPLPKLRDYLLDPSRWVFIRIAGSFSPTRSAK